MERIIIHVDMDAFYASVEMRDDPSLRGKPLIIGALPQERGVVATCSYEAREYGVHSAMNIKDAYRLCPDGIYMHPNFEKYKKVSKQLGQIWDEYASASERIALDEAYLDVTSVGDFDKAAEIARIIKNRILDEVGLTCSVGVAYSKSAAKTASEERKPDGFFEIRTPQDFVDLIIDRDVRVLTSVGSRTEERLKNIGINTVRDIYDRSNDVLELLGSHGEVLLELARGIDDREVVPYKPEEAKSISREITFQEDVYDFIFLKDVLFILALSVEERAKRYGLHGNGVVLKVTYSDMRSITKSKVSVSSEEVMNLHREAVNLLMTVERKPVRLIGVGVYNLSDKGMKQMTLEDSFNVKNGSSRKAVRDELERLEKIYHMDFKRLLPKIYRNDTLHRIIEDMRIQRLLPS